jgi:hypothetical protein
MRPDAGRLLIGKDITIQALPPINTSEKISTGKKKAVGGGKKKK